MFQNRVSVPPLEELTKVSPYGSYAGNAEDFLQVLPFDVI